MTLRELVMTWEKTSTNPLTEKEYPIRLTLKDAAKVAALAEMYPSRTVEQILSDLVGAALNELEYTLPYVQGDGISALDERGDPIYEDVGPTSRFVELTRKHLSQMQSH
ncbi:type 1 pili tip component [Saccharophagus sp. K07]|uniref:type 1 pili tip component n=1 Tax=Saccharophagus sp. K07 TaxID=2283636 RepID=UPI001652AABF|nr:type 1 pili tip component [Saccharophagus sp. K07]MBC6906937.1 type 1 pili tip component [Saccharophagus sp. K07]